MWRDRPKWDDGRGISVWQCIIEEHIWYTEVSYKIYIHIYEYTAVIRYPNRGVGYEARPHAKPVGFSVYLSKLFFIFLFVLCQYSLCFCNLDSFNEYACLFDCVFDKCHNSKRCAYRRAQVRFGSVVIMAGATPPWQTAVFAADHLFPIIVFIRIRISTPWPF